MFTIIGILLAGFVAGYLLRRYPVARITGRSIPLTVFVMLFLFGLSLGADPQLVRRFSTFGRQALLMAALGVTGSIAFTWLVSRIWLKRPQKPPRHEG